MNRRACFCAAMAALCIFCGLGHAQSLDGLKGSILFSSDRSGPWRLWQINADGTDLEQITKGDSDTHDVDPVASKDGKTVLFSSTRGGTIGVWTMPLSGGEATRICDGDQAEWSTDEKQIAFRREGKIWLRTLADGAEKSVSPDDWDQCGGPAWHPSGKTLVFAALFEGKNGIYSIPAAGGAPTKLYDKKGACEPHFTPDGALIVYETETNICTLVPDGSKSRMITYQAGVQRYGKASPDGKHIVYCQGVSERGPWELYVVSSKGGYPVKLTETGSDMNPDWR
jgi:Tol biopolymer transport system component